MNSMRGLDPRLQEAAEYLLWVGVQWGVAPRVTSVRRSRAEQTRLYRRWKSGLSRYPAAPPGRSLHEYGRAFDIAVNDDRYLPYLGQLWKNMGGRWFSSDPIHFEA